MELKHETVVCVWDHVSRNKWSTTAFSYGCVDIKLLELLHYDHVKDYGLCSTTYHDTVISVLNK